MLRAYRHSTRRRSQGFTIIELLVVIAIIAILTAILLPVFATVRENARASTSLSNLHQISTGLAQYQLDKHKNPDVLFGYAYPTGGGNYAPMSQAFDQASAAKVADQYFPGLYPEYIKDYRAFLDPNNTADPTKDSTTAHTTNAVNVLQPDGSLLTQNQTFYTGDAYDVSPQITGENSIDPNTFVVRYQSSWTTIDDSTKPAQPVLDCGTNTSSSLCGANNENLYTHQLRWRNPPAGTYVTSTTYHVRQSDKVLALWENGSARKVPVSQFLACNDSGACSGSATAETQTDVSVNPATGASKVNFWKLDPTGP